MGFYADQVLPRAVNLVMNTKGLRKRRQRVVEGLAGTILEPGFGSGLNVPHYPDAVERVLAVDPAVLGRKLARKRVEASPVEVEYAGLDGQRLELPDASVDGALLTWTLCTIPDPNAALAEIRRVLKPGAPLHFVEHGLAPDPGPAAWQQRLNGFQQWHSGGCNLNRRIDQLIAGAGFEIEELDAHYIRQVPRWMGFTYLGRARS